jgi:hypothetical protein
MTPAARNQCFSTILELTALGTTEMDVGKVVFLLSGPSQQTQNHNTEAPPRGVIPDAGDATCEPPYRARARPIEVMNAVAR